jgi:hypothetical protein
MSVKTPCARLRQTEVSRESPQALAEATRLAELSTAFPLVPESTLFASVGTSRMSPLSMVSALTSSRLKVDPY